MFIGNALLTYPPWLPEIRCAQSVTIPLDNTKPQMVRSAKATWVRLDLSKQFGSNECSTSADSRSMKDSPHKCRLQY
jgi:hypothetical protein